MCVTCGGTGSAADMNRPKREMKSTNFIAFIPFCGIPLIDLLFHIMVVIRTRYLSQLVTGSELDDRGLNLSRVRMFLFFTTARPTSVPTQVGSGRSGESVELTAQIVITRFRMCPRHRYASVALCFGTR